MRYAVLICLWMAMVDAMADDQKLIQLQYCAGSMAKCGQHYRTVPSFFMQSSCRQMHTYLKQHHNRLMGRCAELRRNSKPRLSRREPVPQYREQKQAAIM